MIGSVVEACTSATMSSEAEIAVIIQAAPTDWIRPPKLETRLAIQIARNVGSAKGASGVPVSGSGTSFMALEERRCPSAP